jgi:type IV pilus assembly protein PilX
MTLSLSYPSRYERGAALFFAMMFLVIISIIALAATKSSLLQERMTGGVRSQQLALMGAETALRGGEQVLWQLSYAASQPLPPCVAATTAARCVFQTAINNAEKLWLQEFRTRRDWYTPTGPGVQSYPVDLSALGGNRITARIRRNPIFILEEMGPDVAPSAGQAGGAVYPETTSLVGKRMFYRITARSTGGNDNVVSIVESVYSAMDLSNTGFNPN